MTTSLNAGEQGRIRVNLLGPMDIFVDGQQQSLPRSKKTRALLAYLIMAGKPLRRDQLGELLWDITEDPKGSLRWSLSRLRREILWDTERLFATRQTVEFDSNCMFVDAWELARLEGQSLDCFNRSNLITLAQLPQGMFLEELELTDLFQFNAWCVGQRERFRRIRCHILSELAKRFSGEAEMALPYVMSLVELDPFDVSYQIDLFALLVSLGRRDEALERYKNACRLFKDLGAEGEAELHQAWLALRRSSKPALVSHEVPHRPVNELAQLMSAAPFVGREQELKFIEQALVRAQDSSQPGIVLYVGEPGIGKSRLLERVNSMAESSGCVVKIGRAYELEQRAPYKPWLNALNLNMADLIAGGEVENVDQEALFADICGRLEALSNDRGLLILLDDLQWFDRASLHLLLYISRTRPAFPLAIVMFARAGELRDNDMAEKVIRSLEHELRAKVFKLQPLDESEIIRLMSNMPVPDAKKIYQLSAGNPLYALEMSRAQQDEALIGSRPLVSLVRARIERLPENAKEVIRWGAVVGRSISIPRIEEVCSLNQEQLVDALECLEENALFEIDASEPLQRYKFSHDVVRQAVYSDLSIPRRRLMHKKLVSCLSVDIRDSEVVTELAFHAERSGEALAGAKACVIAGEQANKVFAIEEAEQFSKQGLRLVEQLQGHERIIWSLKLLHVLYSAKKPKFEEASELLRGLAEQALASGLTHEARLGFQMLSFLRWENASMASAHANILQAERISRHGEPAERAVALAQAAKCFLLLERNLSQAEAFLMEVKGLIEQGVEPISTLHLAEGMLMAYRGEYDDAVNAFHEAIIIAAQSGDHLEEFIALEQLVMLFIDQNRLVDCESLMAQLLELGARVRPGIEEPSSRALQALLMLGRDNKDAESKLVCSIEALKAHDAKYQLAYVLSRWAGLKLSSGHTEEAADLAVQALEYAEAISRNSEIIIAHSILSLCDASTKRLPTVEVDAQDAAMQASSLALDWKNNAVFMAMK